MLQVSFSFLYKFSKRELMGWKKNIGQKSHVKKEKRKRKIYEPKFIIKFSKFKVRGMISNKRALELFCTPSPSTNIL